MTITVALYQWIILCRFLTRPVLSPTRCTVKVTEDSSDLPKQLHLKRIWRVTEITRVNLCGIITTLARTERTQLSQPQRKFRGLSKSCREILVMMTLSKSQLKKLSPSNPTLLTLEVVNKNGQQNTSLPSMTSSPGDLLTLNQSTGIWLKVYRRSFSTAFTLSKCLGATITLPAPMLSLHPSGLTPDKR